MNVSDKITSAEYTSWKRGDQVVILAPTGSGKTHFVINHLLPHARSEGRKIIYLCNRTLVCEQTVLAVQRSGINMQEKDGYWNSDFIFVSTYQKIESLGQFPDLEGQRPEAKFKKTELNAAYYCVLDEAHYFVQDALFNANTGVCSRVPDDKVCIYMTATDDALRTYASGLEYKEVIRTKQEYEEYQADCYWKIHAYETFTEEDMYRGLVRPSVKEIQKCRAICDTPYHTNVLRHLYTATYPPNWAVYKLPFDFSAYRVKYYKAYEELFEHIKATPDEKWLIFCLNRVMARDLAASINQMLGDRGIAIAIDAQSKYRSPKSKEREIYDEIKETSKFSCRVLVATNILDNGVNLHDDALKHIAITAQDKALFLQMLGRKRLEQGESVNLYIGEIPYKTTQFPMRTIDRHIELFETFDQLNDWERNTYYEDDLVLEPSIGRPKSSIRRIFQHWSKHPVLLVNAGFNYGNISEQKKFERLRDFKANNLAFLKILSNLDLCVQIKDQKVKSDGTEEPYPLLQIQLSWLDKIYREEDWLDYPKRQNTSADIYTRLSAEAMSNRLILPHEQQQFALEIFELLCQGLTPPKQYLKDKSRYDDSHAPGMCKLNNALKAANLPFQIKSRQIMKNRERRRVWFVDQIKNYDE